MSASALRPGPLDLWEQRRGPETARPLTSHNREAGKRTVFIFIFVDVRKRERSTDLVLCLFQPSSVASCLCRGHNGVSNLPP